MMLSTAIPKPQRSSHSGNKPLDRTHSQNLAQTTRASTTRSDRLRSGEKDSATSGTSTQKTHNYYPELLRTPLLTAQEERELFRKLAALRTQLHQDTSLGKRPLEEHYIQVRNQIVQANLRLVVAIARKMAPLENFFRFDLISEGNETLIRAVELFDIERGLKFSTYATTAISRRYWKLLKKEKQHGERYISGTWAVEIEPSADEVSSPFKNSQSDQLLCRLLTRLKPRERFILEGRFGLRDSKYGLTYRELAAQLSLSKERVRQIEKAAIAKLQEYCNEHRIDSPQPPRPESEI